MSEGPAHLSFDVQDWPAGAFHEFLNAALVLRCRAQLVMPPGQPLSSSRSWPLPDTGHWAETFSWPGTELLGDRPAQSINVLLTGELVDWLGAAGSPWQLVSPEWPEDLALWLPDGSLLFGSISHECDSWLEGTPDTLRELERLAPRACRGVKVGAEAEGQTAP